MYCRAQPAPPGVSLCTGGQDSAAMKHSIGGDELTELTREKETEAAHECVMFPTCRRTISSTYAEEVPSGLEYSQLHTSFTQYLHNTVYSGVMTQRYDSMIGPSQSNKNH